MSIIGRCLPRSNCCAVSSDKLTPMQTFFAATSETGRFASFWPWAAPNSGHLAAPAPSGRDVPEAEASPLVRFSPQMDEVHLRCRAAMQRNAESDDQCFLCQPLNIICSLLTAEVPMPRLQNVLRSCL